LTPQKVYIVAGPPGSGKSRVFPIRDYGADFFNADDRAAVLNGGSYQDITLTIRSQVNRELDAFIEGHIDRRESFAFETTLRTPVTFEQTRRAHSKGFVVKMLYVALSDVEINLERIATRVTLGFHSPRSRCFAISTLAASKTFGSQFANAVSPSTNWRFTITPPSDSRLAFSPRSSNAVCCIWPTIFRNGSSKLYLGKSDRSIDSSGDQP